MEKKYMTVGELASYMGVTVRTLQYYDKEGILNPSARSEGGRRLYSAKDAVRLHQILSFKYLGFSLEEMKSSLLSLDTPQEVLQALARQKKAAKEQILNLERTILAIDIFSSEVEKIQKVDFCKYAEIIEFLRTDNRGYWVWKCFENPLQEHIRRRFGKDAPAARKLYQTYEEVLAESVRMNREGESPHSENSQKLAEKWWNMILEFTGGDLDMLPQLEAFNNNKDSWDSGLAKKQKEVDGYLGAALEYYLKGKEGAEGDGVCG